MSKLTAKQIKKREDELMAFWRAQQRELNAMFPSTLPNSRGATSPLGGLAKPAPKRGSR